MPNPDNGQVDTLASVIKKGVDNRLKELHTALPGFIESFDAVKQTASVQLATKRIFITDNGDTETSTAEAVPVLINVPVIFPRGGGFSFTFPIGKGDECLVVFSERSIDDWHKFGKVRTPEARRFHSLSDGMCFVGLSSEPNKIPNFDTANVEMKKDDGSVSIKLQADGEVTVKATKVTFDTALAVFTDEIEVTNEATINGIKFTEHFHDQANDSGGSTEADTGVPQ